MLFKNYHSISIHLMYNFKMWPWICWRTSKPH